MHARASFALAHPVFDPHTQILPDHGWRLPDGLMTALLTVNIGQE